MKRYFLPALALLLFAGCETTENVADATVDVAEDAYDVVTDAAGDVYQAAADVFDGDDDADAVALVRPTSASGAMAEGVVAITEMSNGLQVRVSLRGLAPGPHGLHIHQNPSCAAADGTPAGAAGGHWDPAGTNDHGAPADPVTQKHGGDLGNITASSDGTVDVTYMVSPWPTSDYDVDGHALVVHSGRDDLETDPAGDSGTRMGCGLLEARM